MTVSTSIGREFDVGDLVAMAYKLAGLINIGQTPSTQQYSYARQLLETIVDALQSEGVNAHAKGFDTVALTAGTYKYSLAATSLDVTGPGMYIAADETDLERASGETPVTQITSDQWQLTSSKSAEGRPTLYYAYRVTAPVQVWVWPIPDEAGHIRFQVHRKLADIDSNNVTLDLEYYWDQYVLWELAHQLAVTSSLINKAPYFANQAALKKAYAKSMARPHVNDQMMLTHTTRWR